MEERNWKYKITGDWSAVIAIGITTAVFGGFSFWLYTAGNGAYIAFGGLTAIFGIVCLQCVYGTLAFKLLVGQSGFYFRSTARDGRYYRYREIRSMWLVTDGMTDSQQATYCNFETMDGKRTRFLVLDPHLDAVDYMIERVEAVGNNREEDNRDREFVIPRKRNVWELVVFAIFVFPVLYLIFRWTSMPLIVRMIPFIAFLVPTVWVFSYGLFFKLKIQKDGFYCRTNPFDGQYYRYGDILDCCLVEAERSGGRPRHKKFYAHYMKFTDRANRTHRVLYDRALYEREMDELVARIERARADADCQGE